MLSEIATTIGPMAEPTSTTVRRPLLGALADTPWLRRHGEVLAVQAVAILLQDSTCRQAVSEWAQRELGSVIPSDLTWRAESVEDEGRPDLAGGHDPNNPQVLVEAKFDHLISASQINAYVNRLD